MTGGENDYMTICVSYGSESVPFGYVNLSPQRVRRKTTRRRRRRRKERTEGRKERRKQGMIRKGINTYTFANSAGSCSIKALNN